MAKRVEVKPSTPLAKAAHRMVAQKIGSLPVLDGKELVGLLSETDLLEAVIAVRDDETHVAGLGQQLTRLEIAGFVMRP